MIRLTLILAAILAVVNPLFSQDDEFQQQSRLIKELILEGRYKVAIAQANGLATSGRQASLPLVEAEALTLLGIAMTENPTATSSDKVKGIQELGRAAKIYRSQREVDMVDSIGNMLQRLTGTRDMDKPVDELRRTRWNTRLRDLPSSDSIDESALNAIVSLQEKEINSLTDSQLRQRIILEQKDRLLDDYAFQTIEDSLQIIKQEKALSFQESRVKQEEQRRNFFILLAVAFVVLAGLLYLRFLSGQKHREELEDRNKIIERERERSDELLLNILPGPIAKELKDKGKATTRRYDSATVMFADFQGFSALAKTMPPEQLIGLLDEAFQALDRIVEAHEIEKIKTIGDAYMCASGLPLKSEDHAARCVEAALEMQAYLATNHYFKARIGIHSGPVVAGVVGLHKFVYDVWGDTVNQASRLETAGEPGLVAISETTKALLPKKFITESAGTFDAKNIGVLSRYFVRLDEDHSRSSTLTKNPS